MPLTNEEKRQIIDQHISNSEKNKYNLEISLVAESSLENNAARISALEDQIADEASKQAALIAEKNSMGQ